MKITVSTMIPGVTLGHVWQLFNNPEHIVNWNAASADWHTTDSHVDLREGGKFCARMAARDGSMAFDFSGTYLEVIPMQYLSYRIDDDRLVEVQFAPMPNGIQVTEVFEAEQQHSPELQQQGWQAILDNFARYALQTEAEIV